MKPKPSQQEVATLPLVHQGDQVQANLQTPQKETTPTGTLYRRDPDYSDEDGW